MGLRIVTVAGGLHRNWGRAVGARLRPLLFAANVGALSITAAFRRYLQCFLLALGSWLFFSALRADQRQVISGVERVPMSGLLSCGAQGNVYAPVVGQEHHLLIIQHLFGNRLESTALHQVQHAWRAPTARATGETFSGSSGGLPRGPLLLSSGARLPFLVHLLCRVSRPPRWQVPLPH